MGQPGNCIQKYYAGCAVIGTMHKTSLSGFTCSIALKPFAGKVFKTHFLKPFAGKAFSILHGCDQKKVLARCLLQPLSRADFSDFLTCFACAKKILLQLKTVYICPT